MSLQGIALSSLFFASLCSAHGEKNLEVEPVVLAPGYAELNYEAPLVGTYQLPTIMPAQDSIYIDSYEQGGSLYNAMRGRVSVLSFIYTKCPDVNGCPLATFVMGQLAKKLQSLSDVNNNVKFLSYSFDMLNDTPSVLRKYSESFQPPKSDWSFVRPLNKRELSKTLRNYNQSVQYSEGHTFSHILRVILIDPQLQVRNIYSTGFLHSATIMSDIRTLLNEADPKTELRQSSAPSISKKLPPRHSLGLPNRPSINELNSDIVALGKQLFFDRSLSHNNTISCALCHVPSQGFTSNELATAVGIEGRTVKRNAPTLLNVGFLTRLFYDSRENTLEQQIWSPLLARNEMNNPSVGFVIEKVGSNPEYTRLFKKIFNAEISMATIGKALASYQRSLIAGNSPFDQYWFGSDRNALNSEQLKGLKIFRGKGNCIACHQIERQHALFTDQKLHNTGIGFPSREKRGQKKMFHARLAEDVSITYDQSYAEPSAEKVPNDLGRYEVTLNPSDRWKFRTPGLRNVALTAPYMHNGSLTTLNNVVDFYDKAEDKNGFLDPLIRPLGLSNKEKQSLVEFLHSLTSPHVDKIIKLAETD